MWGSTFADLAKKARESADQIREQAADLDISTPPISVNVGGLFNLDSMRNEDEDDDKLMTMQQQTLGGGGGAGTETSKMIKTTTTTMFNEQRKLQLQGNSSSFSTAASPPTSTSTSTLSGFKSVGVTKPATASAPVANASPVPGFQMIGGSGVRVKPKRNLAPRSASSSAFPSLVRGSEGGGCSTIAGTSTRAEPLTVTGTAMAPFTTAGTSTNAGTTSFGMFSDEIKAQDNEMEEGGAGAGAANGDKRGFVGGNHPSEQLDGTAGDVAVAEETSPTAPPASKNGWKEDFGDDDDSWNRNDGEEGGFTGADVARSTVAAAADPPVTSVVTGGGGCTAGANVEEEYFALDTRRGGNDRAVVDGLAAEAADDGVVDCDVCDEGHEAEEGVAGDGWSEQNDDMADDTLEDVDLVVNDCAEQEKGGRGGAKAHSQADIVAAAPLASVSASASAATTDNVSWSIVGGSSGCGDGESAVGTGGGGSGSGGGGCSLSAGGSSLPSVMSGVGSGGGSVSEEVVHASSSCPGAAAASIDAVDPGDNIVGTAGDGIDGEMVEGVDDDDDDASKAPDTPLEKTSKCFEQSIAAAAIAAAEKSTVATPSTPVGFMLSYNSKHTANVPTTSSSSEREGGKPKQKKEVISHPLEEEVDDDKLIFRPQVTPIEGNDEEVTRQRHAQEGSGHSSRDANVLALLNRIGVSAPSSEGAGAVVDTGDAAVTTSSLPSSSAPAAATAGSSSSLSPAFSPFHGFDTGALRGKEGKLEGETASATLASSSSGPAAAAAAASLSPAFSPFHSFGSPALKGKQKAMERETEGKEDAARGAARGEESEVVNGVGAESSRPHGTLDASVELEENMEDDAKNQQMWKEQEGEEDVKEQLEQLSLVNNNEDEDDEHPGDGDGDEVAAVSAAEKSLGVATATIAEEEGNCSAAEVPESGSRGGIWSNLFGTGGVASVPATNSVGISEATGAVDEAYVANTVPARVAPTSPNAVATAAAAAAKSPTDGGGVVDVSGGEETSSITPDAAAALAAFQSRVKELETELICLRDDRSNVEKNHDESVTKFMDQIRRLDENHNNELEHLKKQHVDQMESLRKSLEQSHEDEMKKVKFNKMEQVRREEQLRHLQADEHEKAKAEWERRESERQREVDNLRTLVKSKEEDVTKLEYEGCEKSKDVDTLKSDVESLTKERDGIQSQYDALRVRVKGVATELKERRVECRSLSTKLETCEKSEGEMRVECNKLRTDLAREREVIGELQESKSELKRRVCELEQTVQSVESRTLQEKREGESSLSAYKAKTVRALKDANARAASANAAREEVESELRSCKLLQGTMQARLDNMENELADRLANYTSKIGTLEGEVGDLRSNLNETEAALEETVAELEKVLDDKSKLKEEYDELQGEWEALQCSLQKETNSNVRLAKENSSLQEEAKLLKADILLLREEYDDWTLSASNPMSQEGGGGGKKREDAKKAQAENERKKHDGMIQILQEELDEANEAIRGLREALKGALSHQEQQWQQEQGLEEEKQRPRVVAHKDDDSSAVASVTDDFQLRATRSREEEEEDDILQAITSHELSSPNEAGAVSVTFTPMLQKQDEQQQHLSRAHDKNTNAPHDGDGPINNTDKNSMPLFYAFEKQAELNTAKEEIARLANLLGDVQSERMEALERVRETEKKLLETEARLQRQSRLLGVPNDPPPTHSQPSLDGNGNVGSSTPNDSDDVACTISANTTTANNATSSHHQRRVVEEGAATANLEYLKHVMLRYMYARTTNEKRRLLPVLSTILCLTPEETQGAMNAIDMTGGLQGVGNALFESLESFATAASSNSSAQGGSGGASSRPIAAGVSHVAGGGAGVPLASSNVGVGGGGSVIGMGGGGGGFVGRGLRSYF